MMAISSTGLITSTERGTAICSMNSAAGTASAPRACGEDDALQIGQAGKAPDAAIQPGGKENRAV